MGSRKHPASVKYVDVKAATFRVALNPNADADFYGVAGLVQALASLPAEGGTIYVGEGTYPVTTTITLPNKPVAIRGAGVEATILDLGVNAIAAFTMGFDQPYDFSDFSIQGGSVVGQTGFSHTVAVAVNNKVRVRRVNVGRLAVGQRIEKAFVNAHLSHVYEIDQGYAAVPIPGTAANRFVQGPGQFYLRNFAHVGPGGMSGGGVLYLIDGGSIDTTYGCTLSGITAYNTAFRVGAAGGLVLSSGGRFFNCTFIPSGPPFAAQYIDTLTVVAFGCDFGGGLANAIRLTGSGSIIHGCRTACRVLEVAPADNNRFIDNEGFDGSTIIGAGSFVTTWNTKVVNTTPVTLDETYRTVLVDASGGARVIDLPAAATCKYRLYRIKKTDASTNQVIIDPSGAETIDGQPNHTLGFQYESVTIQSDGTTWHILSDTSSDTGPDVSGEPMGFPVQDDTYTTWTWNNGTNTFSISPVGASFDVYVLGVKFTKAVTQSVTIVPTEGIWFFYFNSAGNLVASKTPFAFNSTAQVMVGYYDATLGNMIFLGDERHGLVMDWSTHQYLHLTRGCSIDPTGFPISGTLVGDGSLDVHAQIGVGIGTGYDEDFAIPVTDGALGPRFRQPLTLPAQIPVFYRDGVSNWRRKVANTFALLEDGVNRIKYNLNTAGVWSQPNVSANGSYMAVWICLTDNYSQPIIAILGQRQDTTLANAQNNNTFGGLLLTGLPSQELKVLWRVIYQTSTVYANTPHARTRDFLDFRSVSSLPASTPAATAHNALSGRDTFPAHPSTAIQAIVTTVAVNTLLDGTHGTVLVDASGAARTITLPLAATWVGRRYVIKKIDATANAVNVACADLIDGLATLAIVVPNHSITVESDGTTWKIVGRADPEAATFVVNGNGNGDFTTIQAALAALPTGGGTIFVREGTYTPPVGGYIVPAVPVRIIGAGRESTIINRGATAAPVFTLSGHDFALSDVRILGNSLGGQTCFVTAAPAVSDPFFDLTRVTVGTGLLDGVETIIDATAGTMFFNISECYLWAIGPASFFLKNGSNYLKVVNTEVKQGGAISGSAICIFANAIITAGVGTLNIGIASQIASSAISGATVNIAAGSDIAGSRLLGNVVLGMGVRLVGCYQGSGTISTTTTGAYIVGCDISGFSATGGGSHVIKATKFNAVGNNCVLTNATLCIISGNIGIQVQEVGTSDNNRYNDIPLTSTIIGAASWVEGENVRSYNVDPTLDATHRTVLIDASGAARTVNLPTAASARYRTYRIKKVDATANNVTIDPNGAELIEGAATFVFNVYQKAVTIQSTGTAWVIV